MAPRKPIKPTPKPETKTDSKSESTKKQVKVKSNEPGFWFHFKAFFVDERVRFAAGILIMISALYLFLAFVSYFISGASDQSIMDLPFSDITAMRFDTQNWTSITGAYIAHNLIHRWFGISSFAILFFIGIISLKLLKVKSPSLIKSFFHTAFWLIWLSIALGFAVNPYVKEWIFFAPGGQHGEAISKILNSYIGFPGTLLLISGTFMVYAIISSKATVPFLKRLFSKKHKEILTEQQENIYSGDDEENEPTVAIGTELIPEDWVVKGAEMDEEFTIVPEKEDIDVTDVPFEIEKPEELEESKAVDAPENITKEEENDDPFTMLPS